MPTVRSGSNPLAETFVYQVQNSSFSDDGITTFSVQSFAGSAASVSYNATGDQFIPGSAERSGATTADAIAFYFVPPIGVPGASAYMIVKHRRDVVLPRSARRCRMRQQRGRRVVRRLCSAGLYRSRAGQRGNSWLWD